MSAAPSPEAEPTEAGEQVLVPGVRPILLRERLEARAAAPMLPARPQRPLDFGLFDLAARDQLELFAPVGGITELPPRGG
jgi:hypothetical protein